MNEIAATAALSSLWHDAGCAGSGTWDEYRVVGRVRQYVLPHREDATDAVEDECGGSVEQGSAIEKPLSLARRASGLVNNDRS